MKLLAEQRRRLTAENCVKTAQRCLGPGWNHVSATIRRGLVMAEVVAVIQAQDDGISAEARLAYLNDLVRIADALLESAS